MVRLTDLGNKLPLAKVWEMVNNNDADIVDVRQPIDFGLGHPRGALSLPYSAKGLDERLRVILDPDSSIIIFASDQNQAEEACSQLHEGGFTVQGIADGSIETWSNENLPVDQLVDISIEELMNLSIDSETTILDVREPIEWELGYIPGATLISLGSLRERIGEIPQETKVVVICEAGIRSASASSILQAAGFTHLFHVPDGTAGYRNAGHPLSLL